MKFFRLPLLILCLCALAAGAQTTYSLTELREVARRHNHSLSQARRNITVAEERRREAFTKYFPNVSANALAFRANKGMAELSVTPSELIPSALFPTLSALLPTQVLTMLGNPISVEMMKNGRVAGVTAIQPVYAGGQIRNGNRLARVGEDVSRLQLTLVENDVDKLTEQYYWQLVSLREKMKTLDAADTLLASIHKDVALAVQVGVAMRNDLLQVQLRQNEMASQRLKLNNGYSVVKMLLSQHCGIADTAFVLAHEATTVEPVAHVDHDTALPSLAEYQLLNKQVEAATLSKKITQGQTLPTVAVGAGYNYHNMLGSNRTFAMVFATVSIPISDWWGGSHAVKQRELERQNAVEALTQNSELLTIRMQQSWNEVVEAREQIAIAERSIEQARENLRLNRDYYSVGMAKMSDLLEAQLLLQQAQDSRTDAFIAYQISALNYRQAVGVID